ncbi:hypothetical protein ACPD8N_01350 [Lacticaseibacillus chiayiensis]
MSGWMRAFFVSPKGVEVHDAMGGYELFEYDLARELNIHPRKDDESK